MLCTISSKEDVARIRVLWNDFHFTRINGLATFSSFENAEGHIPEPEDISPNWRGCWGYDNGITIACLENGDLLFISGEPDDQMRDVLCTFCPNSSDLRVQYFNNGQTLYLEEVVRRFRDPYASSV